MEMMSDAIDETLDDDEAEEETEELTNQVLPSHHIVSYGSQETQGDGVVTTHTTHKCLRVSRCWTSVNLFWLYLLANGIKLGYYGG